MEAVPRLPMVSFELKHSPEYVEFGPSLKQYIQEHYGEDPAHYNKACTDLEQLRQSAIHVTKDFMGCSTLKRYYSQLHLLHGRFPMEEGGEAAIAFTWEDIQTGREHILGDIKFEQACILYNIGGLHSILGAVDTRHNAEGMKVSCTHFQCAAWAFEHLRDHFGCSAMSTDMSHELLTFQVNLMLGQAQECILEKSMIDSRKSTITAKVAAQVCDFYRMAMKSLDMCNSEGLVNSRSYKDWKRRIDLKIGFYQCITFYYLGREAEDQQKMGERLCYFEAGQEKLKECIKMAKNDAVEIQDCLKFAHDVVSGKFNAAKKDNDFVYHEKVPPLDSLPEIKGASLVRGIAFNPADRDISGPDIFEKLVPMEAHEASSVYSEEKAKLLRKVSSDVDNKCMELEQFLSSLQLDSSRLTPSPERLPQELLEKCAAMSVRTNAIKELTDSMSAVSNVAIDVEMNIREILEMLEQESQQQEEFEKSFGKRSPNIVLSEMKKECDAHFEKHKQGSQSNESLHKAMNIHITNLKLLAGPPEKLQQALPTAEPAKNPEDEAVIHELMRLLSKIDEMKEQRQSFLDQLRDGLQNDDITNVLVTQDNTAKDTIFSEQLKKHDSLVNLIGQNLMAQDNILRALTDYNARYATIRKATNESCARRDTAIKQLITSYEVYEDLLAKSGQGQEYYKKLEENVNRLLQRCRSVCKVQQEERDQIKARFAPKVPPPSRPTAPKPSAGTKAKDGSSTQPTLPTFDGPKLKDYLPFMKPNTFGPKAGQVLPDPDVLPHGSLPANYPGEPTLSDSLTSQQDIDQNLPPELVAQLSKLPQGFFKKMGTDGSVPDIQQPSASPSQLQRDFPSDLPPEVAAQLARLPPEFYNKLKMEHDARPPVPVAGRVPQGYYSAEQLGQLPPGQIPDVAAVSGGNTYPHPMPGAHPNSHPNPQVPYPNPQQIVRQDNTNTVSSVVTPVISPVKEARYDPNSHHHSFNGGTDKTFGPMPQHHQQMMQYPQQYQHQPQQQYPPPVVSQSMSGVYLSSESQFIQGPVSVTGVPSVSPHQAVPGNVSVPGHYGQQTGQPQYPTRIAENHNIPVSSQVNIPPVPQGNVVGLQGNILAGSQQNVPVGPQGNIPSGSQQNVPVGPQRNVPVGPQGNIPSGSQQNVPGGPQRNIPVSGVQNVEYYKQQAGTVGYGYPQQPAEQTHPAIQQANQYPIASQSVISNTKPPISQPSQVPTQSYYPPRSKEQQPRQLPPVGGQQQVGQQVGQQQVGQQQVGQQVQQQVGQQQVGQQYVAYPQQAAQNIHPSGPQNTQNLTNVPSQYVNTAQYGAHSSQIGYQNVAENQMPSRQVAGCSNQQSYPQSQGASNQLGYQQSPGFGQPIGPQVQSSAIQTPANQNMQMPYNQVERTGWQGSSQTSVNAGQIPQAYNPAGYVQPSVSQASLTQSDSYQQYPINQFSANVAQSSTSNVAGEYYPSQTFQNKSGVASVVGQVPSQNQMPSAQYQIQNQGFLPSQGVTGQSQVGQPVNQMPQGQVANRWPQGQMSNQYMQQGQIPNQIQGQNPNQIQGQNPNLIQGQNPNQIQGQNPNQIQGQNLNQIQGQNPNQIKGQNPNQIQGQNPNLIQGQNPNQIQGQNPNQFAQQGQNPNQYSQQTQGVNQYSQQGKVPLPSSQTLQPGQVSSSNQSVLQPTQASSQQSVTQFNPQYPQQMSGQQQQQQQGIGSYLPLPSTSQSPSVQSSSSRTDPYQPTLKAESVTSTFSLSRQSSSLDELLSSSPDSTKESAIPAPQIAPKVLTAQEIQQQKEEARKSKEFFERPKDPYPSGTLLNQFVTAVEMFGKTVDELGVTNVFGQTKLDLLWKELVDSQEHDGKKHSIAIARCYPMKNRDQDIMPYDETRVQLTTLKDDYINASWINDLAPSCPKFIATQSPIPVTVNDFWVMVYEQGVEVIVMITSEYETGKKYPCYWPTEKGKAVEHGPVILTLQSVKYKELWTERIIYLKHTETKQARTVVHLQYKNWPVSGFPESLNHMIKFITETHSFYKQQRSLMKPVMVHCGNGVGRSGTFLLIYTGMQEMLHGSGLVDVQVMAQRLLQKRKCMIQTPEQLKFCYETLLYFAEDFLTKQNVLVKNPHSMDKKQKKTKSPDHACSVHSADDIVLGSVNLQTIQNNVRKFGEKHHSDLGPHDIQEQTTHETGSTTKDEPSISSLPDLIQRPTKTENVTNKSTTDAREVNSNPDSLSGTNSPQVRSRSGSSSSVLSETSVSGSLSSVGSPQHKADGKATTSSLLDLQNPNTFTIGSGIPEKKRITKKSFGRLNKGVKENLNAPDDPLSSLDPLWSIEKETK